MAEELRRTENQKNVLVPKHKALETMEEMGYNPVREMVELVNHLKNEDERNYVLEKSIHSDLMKHYSAVPRHVDVNHTGGQNHKFTLVKPSTMFDEMASGDPKLLEPCNPEVIDITGEHLTGKIVQGEVEEILEDELRE